MYVSDLLVILWVHNVLVLFQVLLREASCYLPYSLLQEITYSILIYFEQMVLKTELTTIQINKANYLDAEAPFLDVDLSITNGIVSFIMISILKSLTYHL